MPKFVVEIIEEVSDKVLIGKLRVDGRCLVDDFFNEHGNGPNRASLTGLQARLICVGRMMMLPQEKWKLISPKGAAVKEYEAKAGALRLYAIKYAPGFILILGGTKGTQQRDIRQLRSLKTAYLEWLANRNNS